MLKYNKKTFTCVAPVILLAVSSNHNILEITDTNLYERQYVHRNDNIAQYRETYKKKESPMNLLSTTPAGSGTSRRVLRLSDSSK